MTVQVTGFRVVGVEAVPVQVEVHRPVGSGELTRSQVIGVKEHVARDLQAAADALAGDEDGVIVRVATAGDADLASPGSRLLLGAAVAMAAEVARGRGSSNPLDGWGVCADMAPSGELRSAPGVFLAAETAKRLGLKGLVVAHGSGLDAAAVPGVRVVAARRVSEAMACVMDDRELREPEEGGAVERRLPTDFLDVPGNVVAKRALEIAAAGEHRVLLLGPRATVATMLARRVVGVLPPPTAEEAVEITRIYSAAGLRGRTGLVTERPFRAPHHTISDLGLVGGGAFGRAGEASLAHAGVLFLDEVDEYQKHVLESLRPVLRDGVAGTGAGAMPARALLVGSASTCPCGRGVTCRCADADRKRHSERVRDRLKGLFDLTAEVELADRIVDQGYSSEAIRERVAAARRFAQERGEWRASPGLERQIGRAATLIARTIADLAGSAEVGSEHLDEAVERCGWVRGPERGVGR